MKKLIIATILMFTTQRAVAEVPTDREAIGIIARRLFVLEEEMKIVIEQIDIILKESQTKN